MATSKTVTVKAGNTLSGIAAAAGVSLAAVKAANPQITNPSLIKPGQTITIPATATKSTATSGTVYTPPASSVSPTSSGSNMATQSQAPTGSTGTPTGTGTGTGAGGSGTGSGGSTGGSTGGTVTGTTPPGSPGPAWVWDGSMWTRPAQPSGNYTWDDTKGWVASSSTQATANGPAVLGADGFYYQPMSDGTSVKLMQGQTQTNAGDTSAVTAIADILTQAGLNTLANDAYTKLKAGVPAAQIINDIRASDTYAQRFPGMAALASKGQRITEADYINKEQADIALLKQYNIPAGTFDTTAYLGKLIANNVTNADLQARLQAAQDSVNSLDPNILKYAKDTYGLDSGSLAAWALDPTASLPVIQQQAKAMQIGGAAVQAGYAGTGPNGEITTDQATQLANANVTQAQALQGFTNLGQMGQYQTQLPGDTTQALTSQQLINAQFGLNAADTTALNKAKAQKLATFQQGGNYAASNTGVTGLGPNLAT